MSEGHGAQEVVPSEEELETARLAVLRSFGVLDTPPEVAFDNLARLAAQLCGTPIGLVSLVEADRQWFKAKVGVDICSTAREISFCAHALSTHDVMVVPDARVDPRFADNPLVTGDPYIRFYAGAPLIADDGYVIGTLCVLDTVPRTLSAQQRDQLKALAGQVVAQLELRRQAVGLAAEIESRRRSEAAMAAAQGQLAESELRWRALVEHSPVAVAVIGADGIYAYANPQARVLYGVDLPAEIVGRQAVDFVPPADMVEVTEIFRRVMAGDPIRGHLCHILRPGGDLLPIELNAAAVVYAGQPAIQVELRDMSARVAAEAALRESERRWRELFTVSPVGIAVVDHTDHIVTANAALCSLLDRTEAKVVGHPSTDFSHPDDISLRHEVRTLMQGSSSGVIRLERRYVRSGGGIAWAWLTIIRIPGPADQSWTLAHVQDITERKMAEQALVDTDADLRAVAEVVTQIQSGGDARHQIVESTLLLAHADVVSLLEPTLDGQALVVTAATMPELVGTTRDLSTQSPSIEVFRSGQPLFVPDVAGHRLTPSFQVPRLSVSNSVYAVPVRAAESIVGVLAVGWVVPIAGLDDRRASVVRLLADQTGLALRQAALVAELATLARTDALTGLPNRRLWDELLEKLLALTDRSHIPLTVALLDFDHFKRYNDTYGHPAGDDLIRQFSRAAGGAIRSADTIARWGGEEFAVALPCCPPDEAQEVLSRLCSAMPDDQTCSVGYALWDGQQSAPELMARVDEVLYKAKHAGRNRIVGSTAGHAL